jgi:hypothetical protein
VLGTLNEQQCLILRRSSSLLLARSSFPSKDLLLVRSVTTQLSGFFEKMVKTEGGHRALGGPRAGSVSVQMQGCSLLILQGSRIFRNMSTDMFFKLIDI